MNLIETLEREAIDALTKDKPVPEFRPGDTLRVGVKVIEGDRTRVQAFEGVCIARANKGVGSSFTVRKISFGEGVERVFPLYSPIIDKIEVVRRGDVRRAKLYYLRGRTGKAARIAERRDDPARRCRRAGRRDRGKPRRSALERPRALFQHDCNRNECGRSCRGAPFRFEGIALHERVQTSRRSERVCRAAAVPGTASAQQPVHARRDGSKTLTIERVFDSPSLNGPVPR